MGHPSQRIVLLDRRISACLPGFVAPSPGRLVRAVSDDIVERARLQPMLKKFYSRRFGGGPDFSRAAKSLKCARALAPEVSSFVLDDFLQAL